MLGHVMMALGDYRFGVETAGFEEVKRRTQWRWAKLDRIGAKPARQYVGPGDDTVSISGVIFPHFKGGLGQCRSMRAQAGGGSPLPLTDGMGEYWGLFCIESLEEGRTFLMSDGAPRKIEFSIELGAY